VAVVVIGRLQMPDALDWLMGDNERARRLTDQCDELQRKIDKAADAFSGGQEAIQKVRERIIGQLVPQLEAAKRERDMAIESLDIEVLRKLAGPKAAERCKAMTVTQRRAVLHTLRLEVVLLPRQKHGPGFERETVRFNWG
jgi:site-specific DNA recombinase